MGTDTIRAYKTIGRAASVEYTEKKSRFIAAGAAVRDETEVRAFLDATRAAHPDATHHVYAYRLGAGAEAERCSDDGEPSGTAGRPVLGVMQKEGVTNCVIVVTRYFGGIFLGAGGLARAYAKSASLFINEAGVYIEKPYRTFSAAVAYGFADAVKNACAGFADGVISDIKYAENVIFTLSAETERYGKLLQLLRDATNGTVRISPP